jgi:hypothetical protein
VCCMSVWATMYLRRPEGTSPPCSRSSLPRGCRNPSAEEGDSRETVENRGLRVREE